MSEQKKANLEMLARFGEYTRSGGEQEDLELKVRDLWRKWNESRPDEPPKLPPAIEFGMYCVTSLAQPAPRSGGEPELLEELYQHHVSTYHATALTYKEGAKKILGRHRLPLKYGLDEMRSNQEFLIEGYKCGRAEEAAKLLATPVPDAAGERPLAQKLARKYCERINELIRGSFVDLVQFILDKGAEEK